MTTKGVRPILLDDRNSYKSSGAVVDYNMLSAKRGKQEIPSSRCRVQFLNFFRLLHHYQKEDNIQYAQTTWMKSPVWTTDGPRNI